MRFEGWKTLNTIRRTYIHKYFMGGTKYREGGRQTFNPSLRTYLVSGRNKISGGREGNLTTLELNIFSNGLIVESLAMTNALVSVIICTV